MTDADAAESRVRPTKAERPSTAARGTRRFVTTRANQRAAARVMIAAGAKANLEVPQRVIDIAAETQ